jgi:hypothetical protein
VFRPLKLRLLASFAVMGCLVVLSAPVAAQSGSSSAGSDASAPAAAVAVDPCQLVTSAEASSLAGTTYATGVDQTYDNGTRGCVYGYQTTNVFLVVVTQAPDADTAQQTWADQEQRAQALLGQGLPPNVTVSYALTDLSLSGYDRATLAGGTGTIGSRTINVTAIYLLKGPTFVTFSDLVLDNPAPTGDAMQSEAATVNGRLP